MQISNSISIWNNNIAAFSGGGASLLLDTYDADFAVSTRLLKTSYSGALVRIRRDSDNAEKDFYPDGSNEFSMSSEDGAGTSLSTWISTDSGYVTVWYNQGTNVLNIDQTTAGSQPRIVNAGSLDVQNGKAALYCSSDVLTKSAYDGSLVDSFFIVCDFQGTNQRAFTTDGSSSGIRNTAGNNITVRGTSDITVVGSGSTRGQSLYTAVAIDPVATYYDGNAGGTGNQGSYINGSLTVGLNTASGGFVQELILYTSDQTSNRSAIETDINGYYSIY